MVEGLDRSRIIGCGEGVNAVNGGGWVMSIIMPAVFCGSVEEILLPLTFPIRSTSADN